MVAEYFTTVPQTCDGCPDGMECTSSGQDFCKMMPSPSPIEAPFVKVLIVLIPCLILLFWLHKRRYKARNRQKVLERDEEIARTANQMKKQMQGMVKVTVDVPFMLPTKYEEMRMEQLDPCDRKARWYWEETNDHLEHHFASMFLVNTNYVRYLDVCDQLEHAYQRYSADKGFSDYHLDLANNISSTSTGGKVVNADSSLHYDISFANMYVRLALWCKIVFMIVRAHCVFLMYF